MSLEKEKRKTSTEPCVRHADPCLEISMSEFPRAGTRRSGHGLARLPLELRNVSIIRIFYGKAISNFLWMETNWGEMSASSMAGGGFELERIFSENGHWQRQETGVMWNPKRRNYGGVGIHAPSFV